MTDTYLYPAIFVNGEHGISIWYPDLDGCISHGSDLESALKNARGVLSLHLWGMEQDGADIPEPSIHQSIHLKENESMVMIDVYMPVFRERMINRSVNKTLTLPKWLNDEAERNSINFSQTLQQALKEKLGLNGF